MSDLDWRDDLFPSGDPADGPEAPEADPEPPDLDDVITLGEFRGREAAAGFDVYAEGWS